MEVAITVVIIGGIFALYIYDRFIQRKHQLLINYPVIGRMRYLFEILREPLRQYFGDENFFESREKIDWVYKAASDVPNFVSFSVSQPFSDSRFIIKHANSVLNADEVDENFSVLFGEKRKKPFVSKSPIIRSAMSDGALSPEATRAFVAGAKKSGFIFNTGEGGLTSNHFYTYEPDIENDKFLDVVHGNDMQKKIFNLVSKCINKKYAIKLYKKLLINDETIIGTYILDECSMSLFRINWNTPLDLFPKEVPESLPDIVFQMSSGLYGVRDKDGNFDEERYAKVMSFCKMTEIKLAQGAKQTGGKLAGSKVTPEIAYYRGVEPYKDLFSPNRFPYANSLDELYDFVSKLQDISGKPVGIKIVISDAKSVEDMVKKMVERKEKGLSIPDFFTIDGGEGGSATAPLEMMESVGLSLYNALYVMDSTLKKHGIRDDVKLIVSEKILTPDDVVIAMCMGADAVGIARGFMLSGGCIRARMCSGFGSHQCPVGLATQDKRLRASYLTKRKSNEIANYHSNLLKGIRNLLAVMGKKSLKELSRCDLTYRNSIGEIYFDVEKYFRSKFYL